MEADALPAHYDPEGFHIERRAYIEGPDVARIEFHVSGHPKNRMLRIVEQLPEGCRAEHDVLEKATVRFESQELIFSWFNAPKAATFKVSYRILGDLEECLGALQGSAEFAVGESTVVAAIPDLASDQIQDPEGWLKGSPLEVVSAAPAAVTPPEPAAPEKPSAAVAVPAPDAGISFRVQVLAAHKHVNNAWFKQHFGYTKAVDIEPHADWIKYTTGSFAAYEDARNRREQLAQAYAFPGPFVTAYEHGERITVQEALVLAQQEWLP